MDSDWLGRLVDRHAAALELFARQWCDTPEDVVQEAFVKLASARTPPNNPAAWLFRVVRNGALNAGQAARRRRRHETDAAFNAPGWFHSGHGLISSRRAGPRDRRRRAAVTTARTARGDRRSPLGRVVFPGDRARLWLLGEHGAQALHRGFVGHARTVGGHMSQRSSDPGLTDIESALAGLVPIPSRLDRDKLMFAAGAASVRAALRQRWVWPSIAATLAIAVASESFVLAFRRGPRVIERVVVVRESAPANSTSAPLEAAAPHRAPPGTVGDARSSETPALTDSSSVPSDYQRIRGARTSAWPRCIARAFFADWCLDFDSRLDPVETPVQSAGHLRRLELEKLINLGPGGPS